VELFKINNKAVHILDGVDEQQRREGPSVSNIYNFDENLLLNGIENIPDNHIEFFKERGVTNSYFLCPEKSVIDKERLLNISTGMVKGNQVGNWSDVIHLNSFTLNEADECNNRFTYTEDTY